MSEAQTGTLGGTYGELVEGAWGLLEYIGLEHDEAQEGKGQGYE